MKVEKLYIYPIKSLRGVSVDAAELTQHGFHYDRRFMLLRDYQDDSKSPKGSRYVNMLIGHVYEMCLFSADICFPSEHRAGSITVTYNNPSEDVRRTLDVPLEPETSVLELMDINMHYSPTKAFDMGPRYSEWFSSCFGYPVVFAYIGTYRRPVLGNFAPNAAVRNLQRRQLQQNSTSLSMWISSMVSSMPSFLPSMTAKTPGTDAEASDPDYGITFADCSPYLIITTASLDQVSTRLPDGHEVDATKFRPNIIVSGASEPFEEDFWAELSVTLSGPDDASKRTAFELTTNCVRCASINVDYRTGAQGTGPDGQLLKKLQGDRRVDQGMKYSPVFGRYGFLARDSTKDAKKVLRVGDEVEVTQRNCERSVFRWPGFGQTPKEDLYPL